MKLHLSNPSGIHTFTGYGEGYVMVDRQRHERNVVVMPDRILTDWGPEAFEQLAAADFDRLVELAPEIVLLGTGARLRFPRPELARRLHAARIGMEVMDIPAACRTYNILAAEERKVAAALLFI